MNTDSTKRVNNADGMPLVTVAMPIYNAGSYLRLAVLSIIAQTYPKWQLLIIDDGSTDNALLSIADISDHRIKIFSDGENQGLAARLNQAIDLAEGEYFARMDQDDVSYPERFSSQLKALMEQKDIDLVALTAISISEDNKIVGLMPSKHKHADIIAEPWRGFHLAHPTWMGQLTWFKKHRYASPGPYFCEDQELLLRTHETSKFLVLSQPLFAYRIRARINFSKLAKTRRTLLHLQWNFFSKNQHYLYAFLAVLVFIGRTLIDQLKRYVSFSYPLIRHHDQKIKNQWSQILKTIQEKSEI